VDVPGAENRLFNIGADEPHTILDLSKAVAAAFSMEPQIEFLAARNEVTHAYASHDLLCSVFGKRTTIPLKEGVRKMAEWAKSTGAKKTSGFTAVEVEKNMPPFWKTFSDLRK